MIIVEGMDNSGKSTLARVIAHHMGLKIQESEGPPRSDDEINERVDRYAKMHDYLFVRHPCISNEIYGKFRDEGNPITPDRMLAFYEHQPVLIYCDAGMRGLEGHVEKDHDSPEHLAMVFNKYAALLMEYRVWAARYTHFIYRIGDSMEQLAHCAHFYYEMRRNQWGR